MLITILIWALVILTLACLMPALAFHAFSIWVRRSLTREYSSPLSKKLVFVSYRSRSRALATQVQSLLAREGYATVMWQPDSPWSDPVEEIVNSINDASVVVAVRPSETSVWVEAEHRLAAACGTTLVEVWSESDLDSATARVAQEVARAKGPPFAFWETGDLADEVFGGIEEFKTRAYETMVHAGGYGIPGGILRATQKRPVLLYISALIFGTLALILRTCSK